MLKDTENWFTSWFDTPYYHILYKDRDYDEALVFMKNLTQFLNLKKKTNYTRSRLRKGSPCRKFKRVGI
jgi:hypothetical protein